MSSNFKLNIFTPSGIMVNAHPCSELLIPTSTGLINILKGHTHIVTELGTGIMNAKLSNGQKKSYTIAGGLCKVLGDTVTILAKSSESPEKIDIDRARAAKLKAESRLQDGSANVDVIKFQRKLARAKNRLELANLK